MRTVIPLTVLATAFACSLFTAPAHARARVFVASYGNDSNPCTFGSPCKTFQQAVNAVDAGGEVTAIDSAGFGPINITKAVTITSPDGVEAGIVASAGADAIDINAGPNDAIVLRGLTLNGSGVGANGVVFNSGASLTITNCVVQNFVFDGSHLSTGNGILVQPTSGEISFVITDTIASNNGHAGISYLPPSGSATAVGVIDHVVATNNIQVGIVIATSFGGGPTTAAISNSIASNNAADGIDVGNKSAVLIVSIDNSSVNGNTSGISASNTARVTLGRSVITANILMGISNSTSPNTFFSYKDNRINENATDLSNPLNTTLALQ
jgi:hypothetical protein